MNNPFDYRPGVACDEAFRKLVGAVERLRGNQQTLIPPEAGLIPGDDPGVVIPGDDSGTLIPGGDSGTLIPGDEAGLIPGDEVGVDLCGELEEGKMLGVLVARDGEGVCHTLYAFSGQLGRGGFHYPGFVGPVFDYLQPDGYFKTREADISRQNEEIARLASGELTRVEREYASEKLRLDAEVEAYREECRASKMARMARRSSPATEEEMAAMIRQSQFEKAQLRRLKKRVAAELAPAAARLEEARARLAAMKQKRRLDSEHLQEWLFTNFRLLNARGESRSLSEIFADTPMLAPPSGAGECCAPKLLQAAYLKGWQPVEIAEYWYGKPKEGEVRIHGMHYPACRGKCGPVLRWMLQGLPVEPPLDRYSGQSIAEAPEILPEILYENEWFCIVNKPSGMLSVPGKTGELSVEEWLTARYGEGRMVRMAHRLDQGTSGLIMATFGAEAYKAMQGLFARRMVAKRYVAELMGDYQLLGKPRKGHIELPLSPDWLDRPRQRVDPEGGKPAATDYEFVASAHGRSRVIFHPHTGRTHQLRVHAASEGGLGMPIAGDPLYGGDDHHASPQRLMLHAEKMEFTFPPDGKHYSFEAPAPF